MHGLFAPQDFARQRQVADRAPGLGVVGNHRRTVAGRFRQAHVAGNNGAVHLVAEVADQLVGNVVGQTVARVVHGAQQAADMQLGVEHGADLLDGVHQRGETLQRVVLALNRHDHRVRRGERVDGEHVQRRRAVDDDVIVVAADPRQRVAQAEFPHLHVQQLHFGGGQVAVGGDQVEAGILGGVDHRVFHVHFAHQHVVDGVFRLVLVHTGAAGGVPLRINVHQQHLLARRRQGSGQIDAAGGLAHSTFLVGNGKNGGHCGLLIPARAVRPGWRSPARGPPPVRGPTEAPPGPASRRAGRPVPGRRRPLSWRERGCRR